MSVPRSEIERLAHRIEAAYRTYGAVVARWASDAQRGRAIDIVEVNRRFALGRAAAERVVAEMIEKIERDTSTAG